MLKKTSDFFLKDIWFLRLKTLPRLKAVLILHLRVIVLSIKGFFQDKCMLRASSLTFYSLLSIVPVLAMSFGISKGFGLDKMLETQIQEKIGTTNPEAAEKLIVFAKNALENTKGGLVAGIGVIILFWTVISVLENIEISFNEIWGVKKARPFLQKIERYLLFTFSPILLVFASSANVFISAKLSDMSQNYELFSTISAPMFFALKFTPYFLLWMAFMLAYLLLPNTRVRFAPALMGGIFGGTIYLIVQKLYIHFQVGVAKYSAIYGSLAALPLFLIWLQMSWLIVLFGAEISFAMQNQEQYEYDTEPGEISQDQRDIVSVRIMLCCVENFCLGKAPLSTEEIRDLLGIPVKVARGLLFNLTECGLLAQTCNGDVRFQPARDVDGLSIASVLESLRMYSPKKLDMPADEKSQALAQAFGDLRKALKDSSCDLKLKKMIPIKEP